MAIVSISRAAKLVRKGRQTLYNHNDKGKLSFTTDRDGKPGVDTAELVRVYGKLYMPADDVETVALDNRDSVGQSSVDRTRDQSSAQSGMSHSVSIDSDAASTLSWFMEQVDEAKEELEEAQALLGEREKTIAELRKAMAALPSPESVATERERLKKEHQAELENERKVRAEEKQRSEKWKAELANRQSEVEKARKEAGRISEKAAADIATIERRAASERAIREALESRGFIARLLNRKPAIIE